MVEAAEEKQEWNILLVCQDGQNVKISPKISTGADIRARTSTIMPMTQKKIGTIEGIHGHEILCNYVTDIRAA